jgi:hypothetical protein
MLRNKHMSDSWLVVLTSEPDTDHIVAALAHSVKRGQKIHFEVRGRATRVMRERLTVLSRLGSISITENRFPPLESRIWEKLLRIRHNRALLRRWIKQQQFSLIVHEWWDGIAGLLPGPTTDSRDWLFLDFSLQLQVAARDLGVPVVALPHGHALLSDEVAFPGNHALEIATQNFGRLPFSNRDSFSAYVVAHETDRRYLIRRTEMSGDNVVVWGSARFSPEWVQTLYDNTFDAQVFSPDLRRKTLFFLPKWNSRIHRQETIDLLRRLADHPEIELVVAEHPRRGASRLSQTEMDELTGARVLAPGHDSVSLIKACECVVEISSSICIDAVLTGRRLVMPRYLQAEAAETRLDDAVSITRTFDAESTIAAILDDSVVPSVDEFFLKEIATQKHPDTLKRYDDGLRAIAAAR